MSISKDEFQEAMMELYIATVSIERRVPRTVPEDFSVSLPKDFQNQVLQFHRNYIDLIKEHADKIRPELNLPYDSKILLIPSFHCGMGDWVLINQLMLCIKESYPDHKLVVAIREQGNYHKFFREIAELNNYIDCLIEVPFGCEQEVNSTTLISSVNRHGMRAIVWAESLLLELLKDYTDVTVYKYSRFPCLLNYKNSVDVSSHAQHLLDLESYIHEKNFKPYLKAASEDIQLVDDYLCELGIEKDDLLIILHAKFEEDFHHFIDVLDKISEIYPIKIVKIGFEGCYGVERDWMFRLDPAKSTLKFLTGLKSSANLFVGNISGPMHLAASLGLSCVALYFKEFTGLEWKPKLPEDKYAMLYKKAIGHDGNEIEHRVDYGIKNKNVKEFLQVPHEDLYNAITSMLNN